jgi:hypothetical protein
MSFLARLIHDLAIVTPTDDVGEDVDEYGQPVPGVATTVLTPGLIQPKTAREVAQISQGGPALSDHTIFLQPQAVSTLAYIRYEPDDGDRYQVVGVRYFNFGRTPHLEVDAKRILSPALVTS